MRRWLVAVLLWAVWHGVYASRPKWDAARLGRGRLPRVDDVLRPLDWGQLQVLHTTDIHGCTSVG